MADQHLRRHTQKNAFYLQNLFFKRVLCFALYFYSKQIIERNHLKRDFVKSQSIGADVNVEKIFHVLLNFLIINKIYTQIQELRKWRNLEKLLPHNTRI